MVSFSQLPAVKDTIFGAARKLFGPSYFVTALCFLKFAARKLFLYELLVFQVKEGFKNTKKKFMLSASHI